MVGCTFEIFNSVIKISESQYYINRYIYYYGDGIIINIYYCGNIKQFYKNNNF